MRTYSLAEQVAEEHTASHAATDYIKGGQLARVQQRFDAHGAGVWVQAHLVFSVGVAGYEDWVTGDAVRCQGGVTWRRLDCGFGAGNKSRCLRRMRGGMPRFIQLWTRCGEQPIRAATFVAPPCCSIISLSLDIFNRQNGFQCPY
jgi:hypothetical protein